MTSSNGNIFRVTGPLCGEFTGLGEFPAQRPVTRSFHVFFDLRLNKRLNCYDYGICPRHDDVMTWKWGNPTDYGWIYHIHHIKLDDVITTIQNILKPCADFRKHIVSLRSSKLWFLWKCARVIWNYRKTSNISRTLESNKIVDNSDVVGASPVGAAPTTSSFST